jgi:hypothetical protein
MNAPPNAPMTTPAERPTGVTILAILAAIGGVFGILGGIVLIGAGGVAAGAGAGGLGGLAAIFGLVTLVLAVVSLVLAYGFWTLKPWAWPLGVGLQIASLVFTAITILLSGDIVSGLTGSIIGIVISIIILYYLFQPHVKAAFGRPAGRGF